MDFGNRAEVTADLRRRIMSGELPVGYKLPAERELCGQYRVSRPVIREILRGLAQRGLIDIYPSRGSFVREYSNADLEEPVAQLAVQAGVTPRHLVRARIALETAAAADAALHRNPEALDQIRAALEAHVASTSALELARTDVAFHEAIMRAADNPVLEMMFASIRGLVFGLMVRSHTDALVHNAGDPMHADLLAAIAAQDADAAATIMGTHLGLALDLYGDDLDANLDDILKSRGFAGQG